MGHILGALVRRRPIRQGPTFIPGFGAFVLVDEGDPIDELVVTLSGPVVGALCALLLWWLGTRTGDPHLTWAGRWGVWLNVANLLPLLPFDGGRIIRLTGRIGLIAGLVASVLLAILTNFVVRGFIGVGLGTTWRAIKRAKYETPLPLGRRLLLLAVYLLTGALLFLVLRQIPDVPIPPRTVNPLLQPLSWGAIVYCALILISLLPLPWQIERSWVRYLVFLLLGWPRLLLRPWRLLLVGRLFRATLASDLDRWGRLQAQVQRLAQRAETGAGEAAAWAYDALARTKGRPAADAWWAELMPDLLAAGSYLIDEVHQALVQVGQEPAASDLCERLLQQGWAPTTMDPTLAGALALHLQQAGRATDALPFAQRAITTDDPSSFMQFGQLSLAVDALADAEWAYKAAVDLKRSPTTLLGLGEFLAHQGRSAEALKLGNEALEKRRDDLWGKGEPTEEEINVTLRRWQEESYLPGEQ